MVANATSRKSYRKGQLLFLEGQPSQFLYSVTKGMVKICRAHPEGHEQIIGLAQRSNLLVGLQSICDDRYAYSAYAATPVETCRINHAQLLELVRQRGDVAMGLVQALNAQLKNSRKLIEVVAHKSAGAKIASLILMMVPPDHSGDANFSLPLSRREIASLLSLTEETVCRQMAKLKRREVIRAPRGQVGVLNWTALRELAHDGAAH